MPQRRSIGLDEEWPELAALAATEEIKNPERMEGVSSVKGMNWLEKNLLPEGVVGVTWPWGRVALRKEGMLDPLYLKSTLEHELKHIDQQKDSGILDILGQMFKSRGPYMERPEEIEAFDREKEVTKEWNAKRRTPYGDRVLK